MPVVSKLESARDSGRPVRLHTRDGEVVVAQVLSLDEHELVYAPITSSRPERYAVCDSTGFALAIDAIDRAHLLERDPRQARRRPGSS